MKPLLTQNSLNADEMTRKGKDQDRKDLCPETIIGSIGLST
jgi:hypothetical protein